jgi:RNA polymerase-binding transcription factor DksA
VRYYVKQRNDDSRRAETLQRLLARHEAELSTRKQLLRSDIAAEPGESRGGVESSADRFARDLGASLIEATARTVQSIEDALRRLRNGAYGRCLDCGSSIPPLRLQALPFAERCRDCEQHYDSVPRRMPLLA